VRQAYAFDHVTFDGSYQTIAIVVPFGDPSIEFDTQVFFDQFGIPLSLGQLTIAKPQGAPARFDLGWAQETAMNVEWVHAIAPGSAILLVETKSASLRHLLGGVRYAVENGASVVCLPWGGAEFPGETAHDSHFDKPVTFVAPISDAGMGPVWPAASPFVTGVGGTTLTLSLGYWAGEIAWSDSGGGPSLYEPAPSWQAGFYTGATRATPDVSFAANPVPGYAVYAPGSKARSAWLAFGGTSVTVPQWAGLMAIVNEQRAAEGKGPLGPANPALYAAGTPRYAAGNFHDVIAGCGAGVCAAQGYDLATGLGTPDASGLINTLAGAP
jgi:subtilase family serine protease